MNRLRVWVARFSHQPAWHWLLRRVAPFADRPNFPLLGGALAFLATLSLTVPVVPVLTALVVMNRLRWRALAAWAVLGSSCAGALLTGVFGYLGTVFIHERLPQLAASAHWQLLQDWVADYGILTLAIVAASPFPQSPVLVLSAFLGMPVILVFGALILGKAIKYGFIASITSGATGHLSDYYLQDIAPLFRRNRR